MGIGVAALIAAGATGAEEKALGTRLVDQMNALYGAHPGTRANHATGAVFEGTFTPAPGADALSSAAFLKGPPTPLTIRFSNAGGVPDAPDTHPSVGGIRGMAIKFRLADGGENDIVCISANGFPVATGEDFLALLQAVGASGPNAPKPTALDMILVQSSGRRGISCDTEAGGGELWHPALLRRQCFEIHQRARGTQIRTLSHRA